MTAWRFKQQANTEQRWTVPSPAPRAIPRPQRVGDTNTTDILNAEILATPLVTPRYQAPVRSWQVRSITRTMPRCLQNACQQQDPQEEAQGTPTNPLPASARQEGCPKWQPTAAGVGIALQPLQGSQGTPAPGEGLNHAQPFGTAGSVRVPVNRSGPCGCSI